MRVVAVHASDTALAVVCAPNHLLMFAAGSQRLLLEHVLPCTSQTCSVVHLDADTLLAWSGAGEVRSASLARTGLGPPMCASLRVPATALAWHKHGGARQLISGDAAGGVWLWGVAGESTTLGGHGGSAKQLLLRADTAVLQIDVVDGTMLVSSWTRSILLRLTDAAGLSRAAPLHQVHQVGLGARQGGFGACFLHNQACPEARLVAARPGRRLWLAGGDGTVLRTLRLDARASWAGTLESVDGTSHPDLLRGGARDEAQHVFFGRLQPLRSRGLLLSWGEVGSRGLVCVVDTESLCLHSSCELGAPVRHVACLGSTATSGEHTRDGQAVQAALRLFVVHGAPPRLSVVSLQLPSSDRRQATANQPGAEQAGACAASREPPGTRGTAADQAQFPVARATPASSCPNLRLQPAIAGEAGQRRACRRIALPSIASEAPAATPRPGRKTQPRGAPVVSTAAAVVAGAAAGRDRRRGERREATEQAAGIEAAATEEVAAKISEPSHVGGAVAPLPWLGGLLSACRRAKSVPPHGFVAGHLLERTLGVMAIEPLSLRAF